MRTDSFFDQHRAREVDVGHYAVALGLERRRPTRGDPPSMASQSACTGRPFFSCWPSSRAHGCTASPRYGRATSHDHFAPQSNIPVPVIADHQFGTNVDAMDAPLRMAGPEKRRAAREGPARRAGSQPHVAPRSKRPCGPKSGNRPRLAGSAYKRALYRQPNSKPPFKL